MQVQIQVLPTAVWEGEETAKELNTKSNTEVAKPLVFNGEAEKVGKFITACKLCSRMKMRGISVEEQIQ